jgi:uncharacterized protein YlzI (FlbEa/FlbD family)
MKYKLLEDHQVRLSDKIIKAGVYTIEEMEAFHEDGSFTFCLKNTELKNKLVVCNDTNQVVEKIKKIKNEI